jgi:shikimate kinase
MIHLIGPGGAGKTTTGAALAERLGVHFVDLDAEFAGRHGDISALLETQSYDAYAGRNAELYVDLLGRPVQFGVAALSSGFMTYPAHIYPSYVEMRQRVASSPSTFVLLPSMEVETCVNETVRRQLRRPFARTALREEQVIRERFRTYLDLPTRKVNTMRPIAAVVSELLEALAAQQAAAPDGTRPRSRAPLARGVS